MNGARVQNRVVFLPLEVAGPQDSFHPIEAIIDTGYNGYMTLPSPLIESLDLTFVGHRRAALADGSVIRLDAFMARVMWHERPREVLVTQTEGIPLVGMGLLEGSRLTIDATDGGDVTIEAL